MSRPLSDIKKIIIHCSDSDFGDVPTIDKWHRARGWSGIGYHYVITNGVQHAHDPYDPDFDGIIQPGRPVDKIGAHCKGHNHDSIGICLIGKHHFTGHQLLHSLPLIILTLFDYPALNSFEQIFGHHDFNPNKTCPNISTLNLRSGFLRYTENIKPTYENGRFPSAWPAANSGSSLPLTLSQKKQEKKSQGQT